MTLGAKTVLLAAVPVALATLAVGLVVHRQARVLAAQEIATVEPIYMTAKKAELRHYVDIARTAIAHIYDAGHDDAQSLEEAKALLGALDYGRDGYFFVYDLAGMNLMHPRQPELVGRSLWDLKDATGRPTIQRLIARAKAGGGYERYLWVRPSTGRVSEKLGYVVLLERWGWVMGTGTYLDDVEDVMSRVRKEVFLTIGHTLWIITGIAIASVVGVCCCGIGLNISERRLADDKLKKLAQRIVTSQEEERARIARELHDGISQVLVAAKLTFESAVERIQSGESPAEPFHRGLTRLNHAIREVRNISHNLRPALLDHLGLNAALEHLGREFGARAAVETMVTARNDCTDIPAAVNTALFRIAQEALTNIERHASASKVEIVLDKRRRYVALTISDDGTGFVVAAVERAPASGIGLRNMRERLAHLRGRLSLRSRPGRTKLVAIVPLAQGGGP